MFNVKDNYGKDGNCRLCGQEKETTEHVIECTKIPKEWKDIKREDLESENEERLRKVVKYYKRVEEMIELEEESWRLAEIYVVDEMGLALLLVDPGK